MQKAMIVGKLGTTLERLVQSHDSGRTWIDRIEQGPYDTHTLATHPKAPKRLYSSAGDGYFDALITENPGIGRPEGLCSNISMGLLSIQAIP